MRSDPVRVASQPVPRRKLRVAVVTQYFPTSIQPWAGHSAYQTLLRMMDDCEIEVFYPESVYPKLLVPKSRTYNQLDRTWQPDGIRTHYLPYTAIPVISRIFNGAAAARALRSSVSAFNPDIILSYTVYPDGYAAMKIARALKVPFVVTAIGSDLNRIPGALVRSLTRKTLRRAAAVVTVSGDLLQTAKRLGAAARKSVAILNGCDTQLFTPMDRISCRDRLSLPLDEEVVLYVGRLDVRKGLRELIEAMTLLRKRRPNAHCYIVGEGADREILNESVARFEAKQWISFVPSCTSERIALWMGAADLVTLPSYKEGCPNVVIEALASGRPVVATRVGGIPELMSDRDGRLVPVQDVAALADGLHDVLAQSWDARALSAKHSRSWEDVAGENVGLMDQVLEDWDKRKK